jgi:hypothetical protein
MSNWIEKVNQLNGAVKFFIRIFYPILLFILLYILGVKTLNFEISTIQVLFILIWAFIEWRVFFSYKHKKRD